jgi:hypothetical protein
MGLIPGNNIHRDWRRGEARQDFLTVYSPTSSDLELNSENVLDESVTSY